MSSITREYWPFYLEGRGAQRIRKRDFDVDAVAAEIVAKGTPVREAVLAASHEVYKPHVGERAKRKWAADTQTDGVDAELAFAAYNCGLVDELAYAMEPEVISAMEEEFGDVEDGEEEDDEDEEEDGEDD